MSKTVDTFVNKRSDISTAFYAVSHVATFAAMLQILKIFQWNQDQICEFMNHCSLHMDTKAFRKGRLMVKCYLLFPLKNDFDVHFIWTQIFSAK